MRGYADAPRNGKAGRAGGEAKEPHSSVEYVRLRKDLRSYTSSTHNKPASNDWKPFPS